MPLIIPLDSPAHHGKKFAMFAHHSKDLIIDSFAKNRIHAKYSLIRNAAYI